MRINSLVILLCLLSVVVGDAHGQPIRVGIFDFAPLCRAGENMKKDPGLFVLLLEHIAAKENWELEFVPGTLEEGEKRLQNGEIDLLVAAAFSPEDSTKLAFTRETVISTWAQVYCNERADAQSLLDLEKRTIGVVRDDPYNHELRSTIQGLNIPCDFIEFKDSEKVFEALEQQLVDIGVVDRLYAVANEGRFQVQRTPIVFSPVELRFAASKYQGQRLTSVLDYHLTELKKDPNSIYYRIVNKYLGVAPSPEYLKWVKWIFIGGGGLLLLTLVIVAVLRHEVRCKTAELRKKNEELAAEVLMRFDAEKALRRQTEYLTALNETTLGLIGRLDTDELLEGIVSRAASLVGTEDGFVYIIDPNRDDFEARVATGAFTPFWGTRGNKQKGIVGEVYCSGQAFFVADYSNWSGRDPDQRLDGLRCLIGIPLKSEDKVVGIIGLGHFSAEKSFGKEELEILNRFAELASVALDNARLYAKLEEELTERKKVEGERARLVAAIEQAAESIMITDRSGVVQYVNPAFERETGYNRKELLGNRLTLSAAMQLNGFAGREEVREMLESGRAWTGRFTSRKKDGTAYEVEATISPVRDLEGIVTNYVTVRRDVTHEIKLEKMLRQSQKMEAIGTLAGGVAHDFNNILSPIMGYSEMIYNSAEEGSKIRQRIDEVLKASRRAKDLVYQILTFSRQREEEKRPLLVQPIVKEAVKLIRASLPATIEIVEEIEKGSGYVLADPTQIHQVVMNLCTNAFHAMRENGGILKVELCEEQYESRRWTPQVDIPAGDYTVLRVSDTGHGMSPAIMERIFDPYFTTKKPGEGTGMGLAVVHGIVKSFGGQITVQSTVGHGTRFEIFLPRCQPGKTAVRPQEDLDSLEGKERVLLVDDESQVINMLAEMLEILGYEVEAFTDSKEALETFRANPRKFDVVITDQTMPQLTGDQLSRRILEVRPDMPIVLCTGFSESITEEMAYTLGIRQYVMKPIVMSEIGKVLRKVLDEKVATT